MVVLRQLDYVTEGIKIKTDLFDHFKHLMEHLQGHNVLTYQHSIRVGSLLSSLGIKLGFSIERTEIMYIIGILHDIGKVNISNQILNKSTKLDRFEWKEMQNHVTHGIELLEDLPISRDVVNAIASHHENIDGSGYPKGISGEDIPYYSKMIRVVDSYDAMTDRRPYRKDPWSIDHTLIELNKGKGTLYDPSIVNTFCDMIKNN